MIKRLTLATLLLPVVALAQNDYDAQAPYTPPVDDTDLLQIQEDPNGGGDKFAKLTWPQFNFELAAKIGTVADIITDGFDILFMDGVNEVARIGATAAEDGGFFAKTELAAYNPEDGGIVVLDGRLELHGSAVQVTELADTEWRDVIVSPTGEIAAIEFPAPSVEWTDTDATDTNPGSGTSQTAWVQTGLSVTTTIDINPGDRVEFNINLYATEAGGRDGVIRVGIGLNAASPTFQVNYGVAGGTASYIPVSFVLNNLTTTSGDTLNVWTSVESGEHNQFNPLLEGTASTHTMSARIPSDGGGGSSTFIGLVDTPGSYATHANKFTVVNSGATGLEFTDTIDTLNTTTLNVSGTMSGNGSGLTALPTAMSVPLHIEDPTATEDLTLFYATEDITLTEVRSVLFGSTPSVTFAVKYAADRSAAGTDAVASAASTSTTTGDTSTLADATIPAGNWLWIETSATGGTVDAWSLNVAYTQD